MGLRAVQEPKMVGRHALVANATKYLGDYPALFEDISELHHLGDVPKFRGPSPGAFRVRGFPRNASEQDFTVSTMRNYVAEEKMFVCTSDGIPSGAEFFCSPTTTVPKKLPDRTVSRDKRLICDDIRINLRCPKVDYWQPKTPTIGDLVIKYCKLRKSFPGIPILGTKRDIDAAFTRCRLRPDSVGMFWTEFDADNNRDAALVFFHLVLPFGFSGSPGFFGRVIDAVQVYHRSFIPACPSWNDSVHFAADVFVDGGMFLEASIGHRQRKSVGIWGSGAVLFYGTGAISERRLSVEGSWAKELILLGFNVHLEGDFISLPEPKILGAINLINAAEFNPGCRTISLRIIQELRRCINHWANTGYIWRRLTEPINQMMNNVDIAGVWVRCSDWGKWAAFRSVIQFIRDLTVDFSSLRLLFTGTFSELVGIQRELTAPYPNRTCIWFSGDVTLERAGGLNWSTREYFGEGPGEFISPCLPSTRSDAQIDELEFLTEILRTVAWNVDSPNLAICGITDNSSSNMRYMKGKAKRGAGLQLARTFHKWLLTQHFRMYSFYCRSGRNMAADFLTRASPAAIDTWALERQMTKIDPRGSWSTFCSSIPPPWQEWIIPLSPTNVMASTEFTIVEWQSIAFSI